MVGIAGWIDFSRPVSEPDAVLKSMIQGVGNGLDGTTAAHADANAGLAICAHAKMGSSHFGEHFWAVIHGYPRWKDERLAALARERGDAYALAEGYRESGRDVLQKLGGPCSIAIVDISGRTALVAIDRVGIEPMCFAAPHPGALVFGSRTDAVRVHPAMTSTISNQALYNYMQSYVVVAPITIFKEQSKLLRGQYVELKDGKVDTGIYWDVDYVPDGPADETALARETMQALRNGVARAIDGENIDKIGSYLSGGLDSSSVSGLLAEVAGKARTFTIRFDVSGYDESPFARKAAERFKTEHKEIWVTPEDALDLIPKIGAAYDEPFGNASLVPSYYCAKRAQEAGVELMLAGDGGDELFGGNPHYAEMLRIEYYAKIPKLLRSLLIEPIALKIPGLEKIKPVYKARRWIEQYRTPMPDRIKTYELIGDWKHATIFNPDMLDGVDLHGDQTIQREVYNATDATSILHRMLHLDLQYVLADNDLRKVSRMCELAGVRVRYPMLDEEVVEVSGRVPANVMMPGLDLRQFYKKAFGNFLPSEIIHKEKHGFAMPTIVWLMDDGPFRDYVLDCLATFRERGFLKREFVDDIMDYRSKDEAFHYGSVAWDIASLEMWLRAHVDGASMAAGSRPASN